MIIIDANVVLRYLLLDHPEFSGKASKIIEENLVFIPFEVVAEIVYVLEKVYKVGRKEISISVSQLMKSNNITTNDIDILEKAFEVYSNINIDIVDSILCGYSIVRGDEVITFDRKINKFLSRITG